MPRKGSRLHAKSVGIIIQEKAPVPVKCLDCCNKRVEDFSFSPLGSKEDQGCVGHFPYAGKMNKIIKYMYPVEE